MVAYPQGAPNIVDLKKYIVIYRVFLGGKDGSLYEFGYKAEDGWFSKKATKINHSTSTLSFLVPGFINAALTEEDPLVQIDIDDSRHILYTRSEKGTIQVFDLGSDGQQLTKIAALSQATIGKCFIEFIF